MGAFYFLGAATSGAWGFYACPFAFRTFLKPRTLATRTREFSVSLTFGTIYVISHPQKFFGYLAGTFAEFAGYVPALTICTGYFPLTRATCTDAIPA